VRPERQTLDALQISVKQAFLDSDPWFSERFALQLYECLCLYCSQVGQVTLQLGKEREERDHNVRAHSMLKDIQVLLESNHPKSVCNWFIDQRDDFSQTATGVRTFSEHERIRLGQHLQDFCNTPLLPDVV
jgi:hypothetical protein